MENKFPDDHREAIDTNLETSLGQAYHPRWLYSCDILLYFVQNSGHSDILEVLPLVKREPRYKSGKLRRSPNDSHA